MLKSKAIVSCGSLRSAATTGAKAGLFSASQRLTLPLFGQGSNPHADRNVYSARFGPLASKDLSKDQAPLSLTCRYSFSGSH
ncbi:MAG: hypothetical protein ACREAC_19465, partial [Blastocatellia bacterium]